MPASGRRLEAISCCWSAPQAAGLFLLRQVLVAGGANSQLPQVLSVPPNSDGNPNQLIENMIARWGIVAICWLRSKLCGTTTREDAPGVFSRDGGSPVPQASAQENKARAAVAGTRRTMRIEVPPETAGTWARAGPLTR